MATLTEELHFNNEDYQSIEIINVSVYIHPQVEVLVDDDNDSAEEKEVSVEEKRRLFYKQRLEQINSMFTTSS
jgi:hypothetical protein